ncbi:hypothetical protein BG005_007760 [Podila minutissima]|nr:hypothetical protein BG005_007760 [Podila minutissima]
MSFNQKRSSTSTSSSFSNNWTPRRNSSYGHIMAGTGGLPSTHTASIIAAKITPSSTGSSNTKRFSASHPLHPQHRTQSLKAKLARVCPTLVHGTSRRQRNALILFCTGGVIVLIYVLSTWDIKLSSKLIARSSSSSSSSFSLANGHQQFHSQHNLGHVQVPEPVAYRNPDGTEMDTKSMFLARDFGAACKSAFAVAQQHLDLETKEERKQLRLDTWKKLSKNDTYSLSLAWKRSLKQLLPNWKNYNSGWIGQGVVLTAFTDGDGQDTTENLKVQIRLIRSMSSMPIEVWFEFAEDVTEDLHEFIATFGAIVRTLEHDTSNVIHATVEVTDQDAVINLGSANPPIRSSDIAEFKSRIRNNKAQIQKALTIASLINSGFEEIVYFSPSTLPMQSPRHLFQQADYIKTGALFWQHPTSPPAHDSPIWPIVQADCVTSAYQQSWSSFALKHKDSWKGLYLAWYWLTGPESAQFEKIIGHQGTDLLRLAWIAVRRSYAIVDRMPPIGLKDLSRAKGDGIGCNLGSHLYPAPHAPVLLDPKGYLQHEKQQVKLFQQSARYGSSSGASHEDLFVENDNVMFVDTTARGLVHAGSNDHHLHKALDMELDSFKDMTRLVQTDSYAAGSQDRVCMRIRQMQKGYRA